MKKILVNILIFNAILIISLVSGCKREINPELTDQFVKASYDGNIETVKKLYDEGADLNAESKSNNNNTPLMTSSNAGNLEIVKFLIDKGAEVNKKNTDGYNALGSALTGGSVEVVKVLIENKADVNEIGGYYGKTPLQRVEDWAVNYPNDKWPQLKELLIKAGAK